MGFGEATAIRVGSHIGNRDVDAARLTAKIGVVACALWGLIIATLGFSVGEKVGKVFTNVCHAPYPLVLAYLSLVLVPHFVFGFSWTATRGFDSKTLIFVGCRRGVGYRDFGTCRNHHAIHVGKLRNSVHSRCAMRSAGRPGTVNCPRMCDHLQRRTLHSSVVSSARSRQLACVL